MFYKRKWRRLTHLRLSPVYRTKTYKLKCKSCLLFQGGSKQPRKKRKKENERKEIIKEKIEEISREENGPTKRQSG
jgi:hypothetical protein